MVALLQVFRLCRGPGLDLRFSRGTRSVSLLEYWTHVGSMFHVEFPFSWWFGDGCFVRHVVHPGVPFRWDVRRITV